MKKTKILKLLSLTLMILSMSFSYVKADDGCPGNQKCQSCKTQVYVDENGKECKTGKFLWITTAPSGCKKTNKCAVCSKCVDVNTTTVPTIGSSSYKEDKLSGNCTSNNFGGLEYINGHFVVCRPSEEINGLNTDGEQTTTRALAEFVLLFRYIYLMSIIITIICLLIGAVQLSASGANPMKKQKAWGRIKISFIVLACLGGLGTIIGIAMTLFN